MLVLARFRIVDAVGAQTRHFQRLDFHYKAGILCDIDNLLAEIRLIQFNGDTTGATNQKMALVLGGRRGAADKRIKHVDAVDQALLQQEVQGAIHRGRCDPAGIGLGQHLHQGIGTERFVVLPDQLQHLQAQIGQTHATPQAELAGGFERIANTVVVVVMATGYGGMFHTLLKLSTPSQAHQNRAAKGR